MAQIPCQNPVLSQPLRNIWIRNGQQANKQAYIRVGAAGL
jgi:hypothetical protein